MKKKLMIGFGLFLFVMLLFSQTVFAGWKEQRQWKYEDEDGNYKVDEWFTDEAGKTYYLDKDGFMTVGWYTGEDGKKRFFDSKGVMMKGLTEIDGRAYYFLEDGSMFVGDRTIAGRSVYFSEEGTLCPEGMIDHASSYTSQGVLIRETGEYDKGNPGHYLPFLTLFFLAVWMGWHGKRTGQSYEMMFVFAAVLLVSTPLLVRYITYGHDMTFHLNRILGIEESLKGGMFPVRINGFTFDGYGYPDPVFYPQLFLYIPAVLNLAGVPFVASVHTFLLLIHWASGMIMYFCGKKLFSSTTIGCIGSILYTMGIYRLCNAYTRAAYGELLAMVFFPLVIWGLYELFYGQERYWIILPLAFTGIFQSHLISTILVAAACVVFGVAGIKKLKEKSRLIALIKVMAVTLCLNVWTLIPLLQYMLTDMDTSSLQFQAESHVVPWPVLLKLFPGAEGSSPEVEADMSSVMPLPLGLGLFGGILLVLVLRFLRKEKMPGTVTALLWTGIGLLVAASDVFPWFVLVKIPVIKMVASYIQFPWRFLAIATCCLPLAAAFGVERVWNKKNKGLLYLGVLMVTMVSTQYYIDKVNTTQARVWTEYNVTSAMGKDEYLYPGTSITNFPGQAYASGEEVVVTSLERGRLSVRCSYETVGDGIGGYIDVPLLYFPGYRGEDENGNPLRVERGEGNLVRVNLINSAGQIHVFFREPFLWRIMEFLSLAGACLAGWELWGLRKGQYRWKRKTEK